MTNAPIVSQRRVGRTCGIGIRWRPILLVAFLVALDFPPRVSLGQGSFGQQTRASSGLGAGSTMSTSGFSGSAGSSFGSGFGTGTTGTGGFAGSGQQGQGGQGAMSAVPSAAQFGQQQNAQRQFVGGTNGATLEGFLGGNQQIGRSAQDSNLRQQNNQRRFQADLQPETRKPIRTQMSIRFSRATLPPARVQQQLERSLGVTGTMPGASVTPIVNGRTVILRGTVESEDARRLAVRLARIEPGVSSVIDELTVALPPASP